MNLRLVAFLLLGPLFLLLLPRPAASQGEGWLVASRRTERQSDLWAAPASGGPWQRLTATPDDERWPAWHPNGDSLTYAARRDRNWDIYTLNLRTGREARLTTDPHFEGWPAWNPDGERLVYASAREGDLDLFLRDPATGSETNLTADSAAHEFEPRWEDEETLLFVSTRTDSHDVFRLDLTTGELEAVTETPTEGERAPMPMPDGTGLFVVRAAGRSRALATLDSEGDLTDTPFSWTGSTIAAALAPQGNAIAWLERRLEGDRLYRRTLTDGPILLLNGPTLDVDDLAWGLPDAATMQRRLEPPVAATATPAPHVVPSELIYLDDLDTAQPRINERVLPAFQATRARVLGELGWDFLGSVSETWRPIEFISSESDYLSWHKVGRAVDTILDAGWSGGRPVLEVVREDRHGDVYWRLWLRCPVQDGTCGEPLVEAPWDLSYAARWEIAPGQGGIPKPFQAGYYVDFTKLAEDDGWTRISAYETPEFDWRDNTVALEFWHYQQSAGLTWYDAMREVFTPDEMEEWFGWSVLQSQNIPLWILRSKGVPLPADLRHPPAEIVVP